MRTVSSISVVVMSLALVASCSKNDADPGGGGGSGGAGACASEKRFDCTSAPGGVCGDVSFPATCTAGHWTCATNQIPVSECRCFGSARPGCSCGDHGWICPDGGAGGAGGTVGSCTGQPFDCAFGSDGVCGDALVPAFCTEGHWGCGAGQIPLSQCRCAGLNPQVCTCGDAGWICPDGGAGTGGKGGAGGKGGTGGAVDGGTGGNAGGAGGKGGGATGGTGGIAGVSCGNTTCTAGNVCLRKQTLGGACFSPDGGCPAGTSPGNPCCVRDPTYSCVALPAACSGTLTCDCARSTLCTSGDMCTTPSTTEIDCTLLAP
jgi:hypothetical protein